MCRQIKVITQLCTIFRSLACVKPCGDYELCTGRKLKHFLLKISSLYWEGDFWEGQVFYVKGVPTLWSSAEKISSSYIEFYFRKSVSWVGKLYRYIETVLWTTKIQVLTLYMKNKESLFVFVKRQIVLNFQDRCIYWYVVAGPNAWKEALYTRNIRFRFSTKSDCRNQYSCH